MIHREQYQRLADAAAAERGGYALHIGKISDDTFVYSLRSGDSADYAPDSQTVITVRDCGRQEPDIRVYDGEAARRILAGTTMREFSTGRAIFRRYQTLVVNHSAIIGEGPGYAQSIVDAVASKAIKPSLLYQYLEIAERHHMKLRVTGHDIQLY